MTVGPPIWARIIIPADSARADFAANIKKMRIKAEIQLLNFDLTTRSYPDLY